MKTRNRQLLSAALLALLGSALLAGTAAAYVASALVVEGLSLPGGPVGQTVSAISNSAVNHAGGYAFTVNSTDGVVTLSHVWGAAAGGPGDPLFSEGTYGDYEQTSFESFFGISDAGEAAYSPLCNDLVGGGTGLDAVWLDAGVQMIEAAVYPNAAGYFWSFGSRPGATADGRAYWQGGFTNVQGGATQLRGLYIGPSATPLFVSGDVVSGVGLAVGANGFDFDYRVSALGSHWLSPLLLETGSTTNDQHLVMDGAAVTAGGAYVVEGGTVPEAIGGLPGELWSAFDLCGVTEAGDWMVTGDTNAAIDVDEFVMVNGEIVLREGDSAGGYVIAGAIEGAYLNEDGDWAVIWDIVVDAVNVEALILNGDLLLREGEAVDLDGDGLAEPTSLLTDFTGISALTLSDRDAEGRVRLYFTADVAVPDAPRSLSVEILPADLAVAGLEALPAAREVSDRLVIEGGFGLEASTITGVDSTPVAGIRLGANYPNPFNPSTTIPFTLSRPAPVAVDVLGVDGRHVATLFTGELPAGTHELRWSGRDESGLPVASGVYLYRLRSEGAEQERKLLLLK